MFNVQCSINFRTFASMILNLIAAVAENLAIGYQNKLIYWLPDDLKRFKALTTGHTIIMGRKTYESLPKGALPNRRNVVLTRKPQEGLYAGCDVYASIGDALDSCREDEDVFVIGGESLYRETIPMAQRLYLTEVEDTPAHADAFFPEYKGLFRCVAKEKHEADDRHTYNFNFADYEAIS